MGKRFGRLFALLVAVLLVSAACTSTGTLGGPLPGPSETVDQESSERADDDVAQDADVDRILEVELSEFAIAADGFEFAPGETIEFVVTNTGVVEHEFRLSNQDRVDEHVAGGHEDHDEGAMTDEEMATMDDGDEDADHDDEEASDHDDDVDGEEAADAVLILEAGATGTLVFTFPDNDHDYTAAVCLIPGHYEAGMTADLAVEA
ncbi:MAG: hypothetical protein M3092_00575 [Actinomycetia bacterium]|nr:hypothetical protein [Actinomycetes bacterium]